MEVEKKVEYICNTHTHKELGMRFKIVDSFLLRKFHSNKTCIPRFLKNNSKFISN